MVLKLSIFWEKDNKFDETNYRFFETGSGGWFFGESVRNFGWDGLFGKV